MGKPATFAALCAAYCISAIQTKVFYRLLCGQGHFTHQHAGLKQYESSRDKDNLGFIFGNIQTVALKQSSSTNHQLVQLVSRNAAISSGYPTRRISSGFSVLMDAFLDAVSLSKLFYDFSLSQTIESVPYIGCNQISDTSVSNRHPTKFAIALKVNIPARKPYFQQFLEQFPSTIESAAWTGKLSELGAWPPCKLLLCERQRKEDRKDSPIVLSGS